MWKMVVTVRLPAGLTRLRRVPLLDGIQKPHGYHPRWLEKGTLKRFLLQYESRHQYWMTWLKRF